MLRGEVWWARVPMRGSGGKLRPMLVVSDDAFNRNPRYSKVMVVHLTSVKRTGGPFDWEVALPRGAAGLKHASTAKCAEVYTLWKEQLVGLLGTIPREAMEKVDRSLAIALALPLPHHEP